MRDGSIAPCDPKMTAFAFAGALNWIAHWYRDNQPLSAGELALCLAAAATVFVAVEIEKAWRRRR